VSIVTFEEMIDNHPWISYYKYTWPINFGQIHLILDGLGMAREIRLRVYDKLCQACRKCLAAKVCTVKAIVQLDPDEAPYLDIQRCFDCRLCVAACPFGAISKE
jgi:Fe-S-cluster-containing dehydrogenase component